MAGDRGLALVVIGVIGISVLWRIGADRPRELAPARNESSVILGDQSGQGGDRALGDFTNRVTGDYRLFHQRLERLSGMKDTRTGTGFEAELYRTAPADSDNTSPTRGATAVSARVARQLDPLNRCGFVRRIGVGLIQHHAMHQPGKPGHLAQRGQAGIDVEKRDERLLLAESVLE